MKKRMHLFPPQIFLLFFLYATQVSFSVQAAPVDGEKLYGYLSKIAQTGEKTSVFHHINKQPQYLDWNNSVHNEFEGNLRILKIKNSQDINEHTTVFLLRKLSGDIFVLHNPTGTGLNYNDLKKMSQNRLIFKVNLMKSIIQGKEYTYARFIETPYQPLFDRIFKISIVLMLILIMVGMGMTLTINEFALVFQSPRGIFVGQLLQFGVVPLIAVILGYISGFHMDYPYIYVGFILIAVSPGGVVSNLMTHYAKGDLALSISITSFSTVLSLFFTPFLLAFYCKNVPEISIPVLAVVLTITVLVIIPLLVGMLIRGRWKNFAEKATPFFSALGILTVLFIMVAGIITNIDKVLDTTRYGLKFYIVVFLLTLLGMLLGGVLPKLLNINNFQSRAISLETGLRNSALAMTLALLMQDQMGDFYSSMFVVSGVFGLLMFVAGLIAIILFKHFLPIKNQSHPSLSTTGPLMVKEPINQENKSNLIS